MPWWGWLLEAAGLAVLAASAAFSILNTVKQKPLAPISYLVSAATSLAAAALFVLLSPKPPAWAMALSLLAGIVAGIGLSLPARLEPRGKAVVSSHGQLHVAAWSILLLVSSVLVVSGTDAARVAAAIALFASPAMAAYSASLFARIRA